MEQKDGKIQKIRAAYSRNKKKCLLVRSDLMLTKSNTQNLTNKFVIIPHSCHHVPQKQNKHFVSPVDAIRSVKTNIYTFRLVVIAILMD